MLEEHVLRTHIHIQLLKCEARKTKERTSFSGLRKIPSYNGTIQKYLFVLQNRVALEKKQCLSASPLRSDFNTKFVLETLFWEGQLIVLQLHGQGLVPDRVWFPGYSQDLQEWRLVP